MSIQFHCALCGARLSIADEFVGREVGCSKCKGITRVPTVHSATSEAAANRQPPFKSQTQKYCVECGSVIRALAEICPKCGVRQPISTGFGSSCGDKNRLAAGILALLLGGIGVHKFYLGSVGMGIVYLLFCWTGIPAIVALIEGIVYLTQSDESFAKKYG